MALPKSAEGITFSLTQTLPGKPEQIVATAVNFSDLYRVMNLLKKNFESSDKLAELQAAAAGN